ncbi:MAG: hypothetical protein L3J83_02365 [Proteobacteria bacterium]|nr:hypothetical protein [Pseudomonadota bacterium]
MKTQLNQMLTITVFFSLAITTTLAISWSVSTLLVEDKQCKDESINVCILKEVKASLDLNKTFELLIPKLK